jgi:hypothetical protein
VTLILVRSIDGLRHVTATEVPSLRRLTPRERMKLVRDLAADIGCVVGRREDDEPGDTATDGDW